MQSTQVKGLIIHVYQDTCISQSVRTKPTARNYTDPACKWKTCNSIPANHHKKTTARLAEAAAFCEKLFPVRSIGINHGGHLLHFFSNQWFCGQIIQSTKRMVYI